MFLISQWCVLSCSSLLAGHDPFISQQNFMACAVQCFHIYQRRASRSNRESNLFVEDLVPTDSECQLDCQQSWVMMYVAFCSSGFSVKQACPRWDQKKSIVLIITIISNEVTGSNRAFTHSILKPSSNAYCVKRVNPHYLWGLYLQMSTD